MRWRTDRRPRTCGSAWLATAVTALLAVGTGWTGVPAEASTGAGAAIAGLVLGINDDPGAAFDGPLPGATVTVVDAGTGRVLGTAVTDEGGRWRVAGLPARPVRVHADKTGWLRIWAATADSFRTATAYRLRAGRAVFIEQDLVLRAEAVISGQVLGNFDPIGVARVTVFHAETGRLLRSQLTDDSGMYTIGGLPAVPIKVRGSKPGWIADWASHKPTWESADVYTLHAGEHLSQTWDERQILYLDLTHAATIAGRVLGGGRALPWALVSALDPATGAVLVSVRTDGAGRYRLGGIRPGTIVVRATRPGWRPGYANGKDTLAAADPISLYPGQELVQSWDPPTLYLNLRPVNGQR